MNEYTLGLCGGIGPGYYDNDDEDFNRDIDSDEEPDYDEEDEEPLDEDE